MFGSALINLLDPVVLFFVLGAFAALIRSNLEVPPAVAKFLTLYLLMALGLKGGAAIAEGGLPTEGLLAILAAIIMAVVVPAYAFAILSRRNDPFDSAAVAATYGSVSAVTFIAAQQFLTVNGVHFGGYMTAALVVMETPAIIMALLLAAVVRNRAASAATQSDLTDEAGVKPLSTLGALYEALAYGGHVLLFGSMVIGYFAAPSGMAQMLPFTGDLFKGILAFFLLEMGLLVGRQIRSGVKIERGLFAFAFLSPPVNAVLALLLASLFGLQKGDAFLLAILSASASYIVVPAIVRYAVPEARPGVYFTMSLALTFPFNILVGIPLYFAAAGILWS